LLKERSDVKRTQFPTRRRAGLIALAGVALAAGVSIAAPAPPPLSAEDKALVDQTATYLQAMPAVKGRFEQTDARGGVSRGELYLSRPGKARFAYDPPSSRLVISDGHWVGVSDPRLKTFGRYPLGATPLSLFLAKTVRLDKGVVVDRVTQLPGGFSLSAVDGHHRGQGRITLTFAKDPIRLTEWSLTDSQGQTTRVKLTSLEPAGALDPGLFVLHGAKTPPPPMEADSPH
jgi:outer membrane lipoprotein-sorting protein